MVLDDYGKKTDLPYHSHTLSPRRGLKLLKRAGIAIVALVAFLVVFRAFMNSHEPDMLQDIKDTYEKYLVTKEGVLLEEKVVDGEQIDLTVPEETKEYPLNEDGEPDIYKLNVEFYDLNKYSGLADGEAQGDYILFLMPLRNAEHVLPMAFFNIMNLTYDHSLIDIAFLVSDCSPDDTTLETVFEYSVLLQNGTLAEKLQADEEARRNANVQGSSELYKLYMPQDYMENVEKSYLHPEKQHPGFKKPFRSVTIFRKDFGQVIGQGFSDRHAVKVQGIRRKLMGRARNWLTASAIKPYHSWVYWRDVDIETAPGSIIQDLMRHNFDVMVPNVWRPLPTFLGNEQAYDLNTWIESDPAIELAKLLDEDDVIVEGYAEYPTWRVHLAYIRDPKGDPNEVVEMDGVGGVSILARAKIFRQGVHFPAFTFMNHAETEAFGKMAKVMKFSVGGLPHYTIWHIYEPSEDDLKKIAQMERKKRRKGSH